MPVAVCHPKVLNKLSQRIVHRLCRCLKFIQRRLAFTKQSVAPALGVGKYALLATIIGMQPREQGIDGLRVNIAHELANVLALAALRLVRLHAARLMDGVYEAFFKVEAIEQIVGQSDQFLAQVPECRLRAFSLTFTGL